MSMLRAGISAVTAALGRPDKDISLDSMTVETSANGERFLHGRLEVNSPVVFSPRLDFCVRSESGPEFRFQSSETKYLNWLPRGHYGFRFSIPALVPAGTWNVSLAVWHHSAMIEVEGGRVDKQCTLPDAAPGASPARWSFDATPPTASIESLCWQRGHSDWFFRHFDHAATTVISYLLGDSPLLRGRILDIGCGDGITDLGVALRTRCKQFIGIDPFRQFERLPQIVADNGLPRDVIPSSLSFMPEDANFLPFEDDSFDVVLSWGSVEHMAGGYLQALREVKRVLIPDGLFLVAPGLFYSNIGHHLDEFSSEPFFHLKRSPEEVRRMVLDTPPKYIDRSGEFSSNEQYWKWHCELNRITVTEFEKQLRALEFEPWRVALRTNPLVEYTPELQQYSIEQLANTELYMSCVNRKKRKP